MAAINIDSILDKVYAWEDSNNGKKKMQATIGKYIQNNVSKTDAGSPVMTKKAMNEYGDKLIQMIQDHAQRCNLPDSVIAHFASLTRSRIQKLPDGSYAMEILFTDDLTRQSLQPEDYKGVQNIVAIFNNGYPSDRSRSEAISHISGWWHERNTTALEYRPGLYFMQDAANDFNQRYGVKLGVYAELGEVYQSE